MNTTVKTGATTAVGGKSKEELLKVLAEKPRTLGWDSVVVYNRGRANALLMQQYIQKLTAENYLRPIDGDIEGPEGSKLKFFGIQLGIPRLSFENANIKESRARVTLAITAGLAILKSESIGGYKSIHSIMRPNGAAGPTLWLDVALKDAPGGVNEAGKVTIDLSEMDDFDTDLFSDRVSIINAQEFFLKKFQEHPEYQVYTLGILDPKADSTLQPKFFKTHTQAAPGAKTRGTPNFGDGAVVLFVTLKDGTNGGTPAEESDFEYMIPNDENGTKYSSAVLLSNKVLLSKLLLPALNENPNLQFKLETPTDSDGNPLHMHAQAISGGVIWPKGTQFTSEYPHGRRPHYSTLTALEDETLKASADEIYSGLRFRALNNTLNLSWQAYIEPKWNQEVDVDDGDDFGENGYFKFTMDAFINMKVGVDASTGIISFSITPEVYDSQLRLENTDWLELITPFDIARLRLWVFIDRLQSEFFYKYLDFKLPNIDTFLLQNLLFPDQNSMVLTDAHVPGDLAVFGNVNPSLTSFVIAPEKPVLSVGASLKFTTDPVIAGVRWERRALPGDDTGPIGSFSDNGDGTYTAPTAAEMAGMDAQQIIVTAKGTVNNQEVSSSAVVSIVSNVISVNPLFQVAGPGLPLKFTAGTLDDRPLLWAMKDPGQDGCLIPAQDGREASYTAESLPEPPVPVAMFVLEVIQVSDDQNNMGQAHILVINKTLGGQVEVDLTEAPSGKAQLRFMMEYDTGPLPVPPEFLKWTLLAGTGWVSDEGLYTEPQQQQPGFAIVTCAFETLPAFPGAPTSTSYGFTVLPLPLAAYLDLGRAYS